MQCLQILFNLWVRLLLHLHHAVILVKLCHIALLHAIDTQKMLLALAITSTMIRGEAGEADIDSKYIVALAFAENVLLCRLAKHMLLYAILHAVGMLNQTHADLTLVYMRWQCV